MKVRDIQGWMLSAMAVSSQMQVKALTSPEMSCFESQSLFLSDSPPTPFPDMPDGLTDLFQHNWSKMIPVLASGKFQERWVSLVSVRAGPSGCCQQAHSLTFCGGSTEWNQVFFQPMPECTGRPTGHLPPPHRPGFGWPSTKQLCREPQVAAHACAQASSCIGLTQPGEMDLMCLCPSAPTPPQPGTREKEN